VDTLIIAADLTEPPTQALPLRLLGIRAKLDLHLTVVLESPKDMVDFYYHFLKNQGVFDFIYEIVIPEYGVDGIRIDSDYNYPYTIKTDRITFENLQIILNQLERLHTPYNLKDAVLNGLTNNKGLI